MQRRVVVPRSGDDMRCRATLLGSAGLVLLLSFSPTLAQDASRAGRKDIAIPPLTAAEIGAAYAPVGRIMPTQDERAGRDPAQARGDDTGTLGASQQPGPAPSGLTGPDLAAALANRSLPVPTRSAGGSIETASSSQALDSGSAPAVPPVAIEPAPAPASAAMPAPSASLALSDSVRAILTERLAAVDGKNPAQIALAQFYGLRGGQPVWTSDGVLSPTGRAALDRMAEADEDGLDARLYAVDTQALSGPDAVADKVADTELAIATAVMAYVQNASNGRVNVRSIGRDILVSNNAPDPVLALASVTIASDPAAVLDGFNPVHPQFLALKQKLAQIRADEAAVASAEPPRVPPGPVLRVGMSDNRVAVLRSPPRPHDDRRRSLRRCLGGCRPLLSEDAQAQADRHARPSDHRCPQRGPAAPPFLRRARDHLEHGALALASARPRHRSHTRQRARVSACR